MRRDREAACWESLLRKEHQTQLKRPNRQPCLTEHICALLYYYTTLLKVSMESSSVFIEHARPLNINSHYVFTVKSVERLIQKRRSPILSAVTKVMAGVMAGGFGGVCAPCVKCPSELHAEAVADRQALVQRSDSHVGLYVESGGSPSGSRKGFMDKTRVISLSDSDLGTNKQTNNQTRKSLYYSTSQD